MPRVTGKHGGARPGAGRKPSGDGVATYSVRMTKSQVELLKEWGGGDVSAGLRWLVTVAELLVHRKEYGQTTGASAGQGATS